MKKGFIFLAILIAGLITASHGAQATDDFNFMQKVTVSSNEVIDDNFVRFGNEIIIDGDINGDVIVAGNTITINGQVLGDVIAAGENITINGQVAGNVRVGATNVTINSQVGKNVNIGANTATLTDQAGVGWTLSFLVKKITINGPVSGSIWGFANEANLDTTVGNNATFKLWEEGLLTIGSDSVINGHLEYQSNANAIIQTGAEIKGNTVHKLMPEEFAKYKNFINSYWIYAILVSLFGLLLVGTVIISLFPKPVRKITDNLPSQLGMKILYGILFLIVIPIAAILLFVTAIGAPLAIIAIIIYALILYISKIFAGLWLGQKIIVWLKKNTDNPDRIPLIWTMILGTTLVYLLSLISIIGNLISLFIAVWFLGTLWVELKHCHANKKQSDK